MRTGGLPLESLMGGRRKDEKAKEVKVEKKGGVSAKGVQEKRCTTRAGETLLE